MLDAGLAARSRWPGAVGVGMQSRFEFAFAANQLENNLPRRSSRSPVDAGHVTGEYECLGESCWVILAGPAMMPDTLNSMHDSSAATTCHAFRTADS